MKKAFGLVLAIVFVAMGVMPVAAEEETNFSSSVYTLDEEKIENFELNKAGETITETSSTIDEITQKEQEDPNAPKVVTEKTATGHIERLVLPDGKIIAEKTIEKDKVTKKVLNYYYPSGQLMRRVVSANDNNGFYAEEYYTNGKISSQVTYVNEASKIGKEKKYDSNGVLRQEIPWILPKEELKKPIEERRSVRHGNVISYYPDGKMAASFPVGGKGKTTFFNGRGFPIKEITDSEILNFSKELTAEDCQGASIQLSLDDLVELYEDEGDISYNKCGLPYRENFIYEIIEDLGYKENKISYDETGMIRRITTYENGLKNGLERKYDASGNLTAEINYKNGLKDGYANGYFPTKEKAFSKRYENGRVVDKLRCYFPTGELAAEFNYENGLKEGKAIVNSPVKRELVFSKGVMVNKPAEPEKRQVLSAISALRRLDEQCLSMSERVKEIEKEINANINSIDTVFEIRIPKMCEDVSQFQAENNQLVCYDAMHKLRATMPAAYRRNDFAVEKIYSQSGILMYSISYMKQLRQGLTKKYNELGQVVAEMYFDKGQMAESSRSFYANGKVKDLINYAENAPRKLLARYKEDGSLLFSLTYKGTEKQEAYLNFAKDGKDIVLHYYKGKPDSIRESNIGNPYNFVEYNLALGEFAVYRNNRLIKGGKLCDYKPAEDVDIITLKNQEDKKEETSSEPQPQVVEEVQVTEDVVIPSESQPQTVEEVQVTEDIVIPSEPQPQVVEEVQVTEDVVIPAEPESTPENEVSNNAQEPNEIKEEVKSIEDEKQQLLEMSDEAEQKLSEMSDKLADVLETLETAEPAVISEDMAPALEDFEIEEIVQPATETVKDNTTIDEALISIPSEEEKRQAELAAQNIGPVVKPDLNQMTDVVQKEKMETETKPKEVEEEAKIEKFYYPNGNLRKTVKTRGTRTEEVKEYSKNQQLLTSTVYGKDSIVTEKYFSTGKVRRRIEKSYDDNAVKAFISREDFYDDGKPRYEIRRQPDKILFTEKNYDAEGNLISQIVQNGALTFDTSEYDKDGKVIKESYNGIQLKNVLLSGSRQYLSILDASDKLLMSIIFAKDGEINIDTFDADGKPDKGANLSTEGTLYIEKPEKRVVPAYLERYWVSYNNPLWIENQDKYSIKSIALLYIDTVMRILTEMKVDVPQELKDIRASY